MKVEYNGYVVEGSVDEIKSLLDKGVNKIRGKRGKYKMSNAHKDAIGKGVSKDATEKGATDEHARWTPEEEDKLKKLKLEDKLKHREIGDELGRTKGQIKDKISNLKKSGKWETEKPTEIGYITEEQEEYILNAKLNNVSYANLASRINKKFGTNYSKDEIKNKFYEIRG